MEVAHLIFMLYENINDMVTYKECNFNDVITLMEAIQSMETHCQHVVCVVKKTKMEDHKFLTRLTLTYKVAGPTTWYPDCNLWCYNHAHPYYGYDLPFVVIP
jgi:hypothetical protein